MDRGPAYVNRGWADVESDHRRGRVTRLVVDDLANIPEGRTPSKSSSVERKDAAWTGNLLIIDGVWDTPWPLST